MNKLMEDYLEKIKWLGWYLNNEDINIILKAAYGNPIGNYLEEKKSMFHRNRMSWFMSLDSDCQRIVLRAAIDKYSEKQTEYRCCSCEKVHSQEESDDNKHNCIDCGCELDPYEVKK